MSKEITMISHLTRAKGILPKLLKDSRKWESLMIDDERPNVDRLWLDHPDGWRLSLHRIYYCNPGTALYHKHPWPSAMLIVRGSYRMQVGYGEGDTPPPVASDLTLVEGSTYAMEDPHTWHSVRPIGEEAYSLMVTGKPWLNGHRRPHKHLLGPLSNHRKQSLLEVFRTHFPAQK